MTKLTDLADPATNAARIMLVGYPGAGKTGALCSLIDAGFTLRVLAYDPKSNMAPLWTYVKDKSKIDNVDVCLLEDKMRMGDKHVEPAGTPTAYRDGYKALDHWAYGEGEALVDLGRSRDWGPDTIVVLDSITKMGEASKRRSMALASKTIETMTDRVWGMAMAEQLAFIEKLVAGRNRFHLIVLAHLKIIAPKSGRKGDSDLTLALKERVAELVPTRYYPSALGQALPPEIGGNFSTLLSVENRFVGGKAKRVINAVPRPELDLKIPAVNLPKDLSIEDGMLTVFKALGCPPPVAA